MSLWTTPEEEFLQAPVVPELSLSSCISSRGIRAFLKLSRYATDDVLKQRLNAVLNNRDGKNPDGKICDTFTSTIIFPAWEDRAKAIKFCDSEATAMRQKIEHSQTVKKEKEYNLRLDPYAARDDSFDSEKMYRVVDSLQNWINNEKDIESIVRDRSIEILNDSCGYRKWFEEFTKLSGNYK